MIIEENMKLSAEILQTAIATGMQDKKDDYVMMAEIILDRIGDFKILEVSEFMQTMNPNSFEPMIHVQIKFDDDIIVDRKENIKIILEQITMNNL